MLKYQFNKEIPFYVEDQEVVEDTIKLIGEEAESAAITYVYFKANRGARLLLVTGNKDKKAFDKVYKAVKSKDNGRLFINFVYCGREQDSNVIILSHISEKEMIDYLLKKDLKKLKGKE